MRKKKINNIIFKTTSVNGSGKGSRAKKRSGAFIVSSKA